MYEQRVALLYENKFLQSLLKNLLLYGSKTIKDVAQGKKTTNETKLIKVLLDLLQEKYTENASIFFDNKIIKKNLTLKPSSKNVVKYIYFLIMTTGITLKELNEKEKDIEVMINKLKSISRFFPIKKHLIVKVRQLKDIKAHYLGESTSSVDTVSSELESLMKKFGDETTLNFELLNLILDSWNKEIVSRHKVDSSLNISVSTRFQQFFTELISKCKIMLDDETGSYEKISEDIKTTINKINILLSLLEPGKNQDAVNECLNWFRELRYKYKSDEEKFNKREQDRLNKSYSVKSLEKTLNVYVGVLRYANKILRTYGDGKYPLINENILQKYSDMIQDKDPKLLDKKFYEKILKDIRRITEKAISDVKINKGLSTQGKILKAIMAVFK